MREIGTTINLPCKGRCGGASPDSVARGYSHNHTPHQIVKVGPSHICSEGVSHREITLICSICGAAQTMGESNYSDAPAYG